MPEAHEVFDRPCGCPPDATHSEECLMRTVQHLRREVRVSEASINFRMADAMRSRLQLALATVFEDLPTRLQPPPASVVYMISEVSFVLGMLSKFDEEFADEG